METPLVVLASATRAIASSPEPALFSMSNPGIPCEPSGWNYQGPVSPECVGTAPLSLVRSGIAAKLAAKALALPARSHSFLPLLHSRSLGPCSDLALAVPPCACQLSHTPPWLSKAGRRVQTSRRRAQTAWANRDAWSAVRPARNKKLGLKEVKSKCNIVFLNVNCITSLTFHSRFKTSNEYLSQLQ